eukprot:ANDGO_02816.mRNA.1 PHD finger protein ING2
MANPAPNPSFLDRFLDDVVGIRGDLRKHLSLMRELDDACENRLMDVEDQASRYVAGLQKATRQKQPKLPAPEILSRLRSQYDQALTLSDEKIAISRQVYELVDRLIQKLDKDLFDFEAEFGDVSALLSQASLSKSGSQSKDKGGASFAAGSGANSSFIGGGGGSGSGGISLTGSNRKRTASQVSASTVESSSVVADMPIDSSEPRYCVCNNVSYGEMVACDNPDCPHGEWFHYVCVGLKSAPSGTWYCPGCREEFKAIAQKSGVRKKRS